MNEEFIAQVIAELIGYPCNFSPCEEELHNTEERMKWCEEHCNKCSATNNLLHYFQIKYTERNTENE